MELLHGWDLPLTQRVTTSAWDWEVASAEHPPPPHQHILKDCLGKYFMRTYTHPCKPWAPHSCLKPVLMRALFNYFCWSLCSLKLLNPDTSPGSLARAAVPAAEGTGPAGSRNNQNCNFKNNFQFIPFSVQLRWELNRFFLHRLHLKYTALSLSASLEETYENQLNKHICAQSPGNAEWASRWGNRGGLQCPETDPPLSLSTSRLEEAVWIRASI